MTKNSCSDTKPINQANTCWIKKCSYGFLRFLPTWHNVWNDITWDELEKTILYKVHLYAVMQESERSASNSKHTLILKHNYQNRNYGYNRSKCIIHLKIQISLWLESTFHIHGTSTYYFQNELSPHVPGLMVCGTKYPSWTKYRRVGLSKFRSKWLRKSICFTRPNSNINRFQVENGPLVQLARLQYYKNTFGSSTLNTISIQPMATSKKLRQFSIIIGKVPKITLH